MKQAEAAQMMGAIEEINSCLHRAGEACESVADDEIQKLIKWKLGQTMTSVTV